MTWARLRDRFWTKEMSIELHPRTPAWVRERVRAEKRLRRGWKGEEEFDVAYARQDSWYNQGISIFMIIIFNDN